MAFSFNGGTGSRRRGRGDVGAIADINVTPFVDVVLVLLIMFMLTAHVMEFGMELDVPRVRNVKETAQEMPVVNLTKDGKLYLNDTPMNINELAGALEKRFGRGRGAYVRADKETPWEDVAQVMNQLSFAKIQVYAVTQPEDVADKKRK